MWNVKEKVIPVIIGANGNISKSLRQFLGNVPGKHEIKEVHCTPTSGSADVKVRNIFHGRCNFTWSINCKYRTAATS